MRTWTSTLMLVALLAVASALPSAAAADSAPSRTLVCMTAPTGPLTGPAAQPLSVGTAKGTAAGPTTTLPPVILLTPQPQTGAYVVSTMTTMPSLPGVTVSMPQVVIPPLPAPGQNRAVVATQQLQSAVGPSATATPICY